MSDDSSDFNFTDQDGLFEFQKEKSFLAKIFFNHDCLYQKDTGNEYEEFWKFLTRYQSSLSQRLSVQSFHKNASNTQKSGHAVRKWRINVRIHNPRLEEQIRRMQTDDDPRERRIPAGSLRHFHYIYLLFYDFRQKQKFQKLRKLRRDQAALPTAQYREQICSTLLQQQILVVAGDTGCGKSTQVPQYLAAMKGALEPSEPPLNKDDESFGKELSTFPRIAVTQPRRIACTSLAARVSYETLNVYGNEIGYQVRFEKQKSRATRILFLTEGLLLRQLQTDPYLSMYDVLILDEVHERHIHTDFLLGVLKCLVQVRPQLRLVLMSATINVDMFATYFSNCPIVRIPGRLYPIKLEYHPVKLSEQTGKTERLDPGPYLRLMQHIDNAYPSTERGDLLIFVSGFSDIQSVVDAGRQYAQQTKRWIVLPLHSSLSLKEQDKVFDIAPDGVRKCIVSTNIAETSVTIDGIRFVADSGKVKELSWDPATKMQRLKQFTISRASAEQRKGRAGRTGPGVCFRLYSEAEFHEMPEFTSPSIQRLPLDTLILQLLSMGLPDIRRFPFIEPPPKEKIDEAVAFLKEQGALTADETLTTLGRTLAQLPMDVRLGKMLLLGSAFHVTEQALLLVAALNVASPLTARAYSNHDMRQQRETLESDHGDPFMLMNIFQEWWRVKSRDSQSTRRWCRQRGIEEQRLYEMSKLVTQLRGQLQEHGLYFAVVDEAEDGTTRRSGASASREWQQREETLKRELRLARREKRLASKRRKVLSFHENEADNAVGPNSSEGSSNEDAEDESTTRHRKKANKTHRDVSEVEFELLHGSGSSLHAWCDATHSLTCADVVLLKLLLAAGLYPQFAYPDESNNFEYGSEQAFHTRSQAFVLLHPNDYYCSYPDHLRPRAVKGGPRVAISSGHKTSIIGDHQLLAYVSLLETTKPFLVHSIRIPALQSLLLLSQKVDTTNDLCRLVFDEWLCVTLQCASQRLAQQVVLAALRSRVYFEVFLQLHLDEISKSLHGAGDLDVEEDDVKEKDDGDVEGGERRGSKSSRTATTPTLGGERLRRMEKFVSQQMVNFLDCKVPYSIRRVLAAERKHMFRAPWMGMPVSDNLVTTFFHFGSLVEEVPESGSEDKKSPISDTEEEDVWTCPECEETLLTSVLERVIHLSECVQESISVLVNTASQSTNTNTGTGTGHSSSNAVREHSEEEVRHFLCDKCDCSLYVTRSEAMRHRKNCSSATAISSNAT